MPASNVNPSGVPILAGTALYTPSAAITTTTTSADIPVGQYRSLAVDVNISAVSGTSPSYTFSINRKGADGVYYTIYNGSSQTAIGKLTLHLGVGATLNVEFGDTIQIVETITGTTPSFTRSVSIKGK